MLFHGETSAKQPAWRRFKFGKHGLTSHFAHFVHSLLDAFLAANREERVQALSKCSCTKGLGFSFIMFNPVIDRGLPPTAQVLAILHDLPTLARLNPLVKDIKQHPLKENTWVLTDTIRLFGLIDYSFDYEIDTTNVADGMDSVVRAPMGVVLRQQWRVLPAENRRSVLTEIVSVEASAIIMYTLTANLDSSHRELRERLASLAEQ